MPNFKKNPEQQKYLYETLCSGKFDSAKLGNDLAKKIEVASKIAKNCTEEEFLESISTDQLPAVKLSPDEMELIKGGGKTGWLGIISLIYDGVKGFYDGFNMNPAGSH